MTIPRGVKRATVVAAAVFAAVAAILVAHSLSSATSISIRYDTLIVNGPDPVPLYAQPVDGGGRSVWPRALLFTSSDRSVAGVDDGKVECRHTGDATITIWRGTLARKMLVRCRPIRGFGFSDVLLQAGGPPEVLMAAAHDTTGRQVTLMQGSAGVRDPGIVQLRGNLLYPIAFGRTTIDLQLAGGATTSFDVFVIDTLFNEVVELPGGRIQQWRFPAGSYEISLARSNGGDVDTPLVLRLTNGRCSYSRKAAHDYYCIFGDSAVVTVRNPRSSTAPRSAVLRVIHLPALGRIMDRLLQ
ncbi:MAG TPA: hypothetical protein VFT57_08015 [Gemmatimonadaceae bacterium]|nr:hypothetical protein [Gemmatimonadaceae bacterium]